eukprot:477865-Rhodomonas_salina.1
MLLRYGAMGHLVRACYATSGTDLAYAAAIGLRACYAMSGTEEAYALAYAAMGHPEIGYVALVWCYETSSTEIEYGAMGHGHPVLREGVVLWDIQC